MSDEYSEEEMSAAADLLMTLMRANGVACSTVSDGHLLAFKRKTLQAYLDANPESEELVIFVKRPDMQ